MYVKNAVTDNGQLIDKTQITPTCEVAVEPEPVTFLKNHVLRLLENRFGSVYVLSLIFILISTATRLVLLLDSFDEIDASPAAILHIFTAGFLFDAVTLSYFLIPFVLYLICVPDKIFIHRVHAYILHTITGLTTVLLTFTAFAEYFFWQEFEVRFDFIAVDYLVYRREVTENIYESYPLPIILAAVIIISLLLFIFSKKYINLSINRRSSYGKRFLHGCVLLIVPYLSYLYIDNSFSRVSTNKFNINLACNGIYSFFQSFKNSSINYDDTYVSRVTVDVFRDLRSEIRTAESVYTDTTSTPHNIQRLILNNGAEEKRYNVILVVIESMSAKFLGVYNNKDNLTPNLDALAKHGLLFTNFYATGTRTVRGLEAITLSVPPVPGLPVIKRPDNENLFTIGTVFKEKGYINKFIYGGSGYFDNMNYFFKNNHFLTIDRYNFTNSEITFKNAWGVCDGDLYNKTIQEADSAFNENKNFFLLSLTTSNHRPYTYPGNKIDIPSGNGRTGAVKYSDYAIGEFIQQAQSKPWFSSTIFVFVADHCTRSGGKKSVPVENYMIPLIIYAPGIVQPGRIGITSSQIDVAPTLFDLMNWSYTSSFMGKPVTRMTKDEGRAFISNHLTLGYLNDNYLVVLEPQKKITAYAVDPKDYEETETEEKDVFVDKAVDYYQGASYLFAKQTQ